ncbi:MAG: choice-of-anchor Q domain-containing protein [Acidimicrobiia bacterium]
MRQVIEAQAVNGGADSVVLEAGATYVLTCAQGGDIDHGDTPLEIVGNGATITMEAACEERILDNGTGALVIRDVDFTGIDLTIGANYNGGIVITEGPFDLLGGRVADNTFDTAANNQGGFFYMSGNNLLFVVDGTVFDNNDRTANNDCGVLCSNGSIEVRNAVFTNTTAQVDSLCGGIACLSRDLTISDSTIADTTNTDSDACGGIGCLGGDTTFTGTVITGTSTSGDDGVCGGIVCSGGDFTVTDSSITATTVNDVADEIRGAIACTDGGMEVVRSTISGTRLMLVPSESSNDCGSMVCIDGAIRIVNSTVADNTTTGGENLPSAFDTGDPAAAFDLVYATFVGNSGSENPAIGATREFSTFASVITGSGSGGSCGGSVTTTSNGYNFADDTTCDLTGTGDVRQSGADPQLAALAENGGPGPTMLPAAGSPLIDAVPAAACQSDGAAGITTDERSLPRPSVPSPSCDIGAVEVQPVPVALTPTFTG